jgi:hypothetical protein
MLVSISAGWKVVLAVALIAAVLLSARARRPRRSIDGADLRWLVLAALTLYAVGTVAWLNHRVMLAIVVYAAGIATAALGAWLSRGGDSEDGPPWGHDPFDEEPPEDPAGPCFDWDAFERDLRAYVAATPPLGVSPSGETSRLGT